MKVHRDYDDGVDVRKLLAAMVYNHGFIAQISAEWTRSGLFASTWANMIAGWCVDHFNRYHLPIGKNIEVVFDRWDETRPDDDPVAESIDDFLSGLPDEGAGDDSVEFLADLAGRHFGKVRIAATMESINDFLDRGDPDRAYELFENTHRINIGHNAYSMPLTDFGLWDAGFQMITDRSFELITYPGVAGDFFEGAFRIGELYGFMAPDKTGKSTYLIDATYRALRQGWRVAYFDTGDSNEAEVNLNLGLRATRSAPPGVDVFEPVLWEQEIEDDPSSDWVLERSDNPRPVVESVVAYRHLRKLSSNGQRFRLSCHANSTLSASDLQGILSDWDRQDDWRPHVVIVDYADILSDPPGFSNKHEAIDQNWKTLRTISQKNHCLLLTATQSNAAAYGNTKALLSRSNFSGSKGKLAHVNGMIGINVADDEREQQCARLNWVVRRKVRGKQRSRKVIHTAGCFDSVEPIILSRW